MISAKELERIWRQNTVARRRERPDLQQKQDESGHGNRRTYAYWFCRCAKCRRANMRYCKVNKIAKARSNAAGKRKS